ncbi:MAG: methyl-accepting chemotaxis protein [bacterium]|nr:methyl-accepting chemotaxis protein [bacterium]
MNMAFFNNRSLQFKILVSISTLFLLTICGLIVYNVTAEHRNINSEMIRNGALTANLTMESIRAPMGQGDNDAVSLTLKHIKEGTEGFDIYVVGVEGKVAWSTEAALEGKTMSSSITNPDLGTALEECLKKGAVNTSGYEETVDGRPFLSMVQPIMNEKSCLECHEKEQKVLGAFLSRQSTTAVKKLLRGVTFNNIIFGVLSFLLTGVALFLLIRFLVIRPVSRIVDVLKDISKGGGDLTARLDNTGKDELGELAYWFNNFVEELQGIIKQIVDVTEEFSYISKEINTGSNDLADQTNMQAASITETSSTLVEFSRSVKHNTENAARVNTEIGEFNRELGTKKELIDNVTATMKDINQSSVEINNIVNVINDISFQTNLLALNAAVEAARAGEAARGFAVVASEVRNLAQKTTEASKNIRLMVEKNVDSAQSGMGLVGRTSEYFSTMITVMDGLLKILREISDDASQQTTGIEQINISVDELEQGINHNASLGEELSTKVHLMNENVDKLMQLIRNFKVD